MGTSLILHSTPEGVAWGLSGNLTNPDFTTDPADLNDGCPANRTEIRWGSDTPSTSHVLEIQALWETPQPVRAIVIRDMSAPAGAKVIVKGMREADVDYTYNLGGNSQTQNVFEFADGSTGLIVICSASNDPLIGVQVALWNDLGGVTYIAASEHIYIGDIDFFQAFEPPDAVEYNWRPSFANASPDRRSPNEQPHKVLTRPSGVMEVTLTYAAFDVAFGKASEPTAMDYDKLAYLLVSGDKAGVIVRYTSGANLDTWALHRTATVGVPGQVYRPEGQGGNFFKMSFAINEVSAGN